jgi:hypothetical protein
VVTRRAIFPRWSNFLWMESDNFENPRVRTLGFSIASPSLSRFWFQDNLIIIDILFIVSSSVNARSLHMFCLYVSDDEPKQRASAPEDWIPEGPLCPQFWPVS